MKVMILAGGGGTRLFPLSRTSYPKQFLKIGSDKTLLTQTLERFLELVNPRDIMVVTNKEYFYHVKSELRKCGAEEAHILLEPTARNTAPAITLGVRYCLDKLGVNEKEVLFISPSDHIIKPINSFLNDIKQIVDLAKGDKIATLGVKPDKPETGYGYIKGGKPLETGFMVEKFVEKPDREKAMEYLAEGNYFWNAGIYAFSISTFKGELSVYQPEMFKLFNNNSFDELVNKFDDMQSISIDYAIAEKSKRVVVLPLSAYWNDIGSWDAIYDVMDKDKHKNVTSGDCLAIDCSQSLIIGDKRLVAGVGLEDTIVVETDDVVVVAKKGESQKVKDVVAELRKRKRKEAGEHTTGYRPWGSYNVIASGSGYKVKKLNVDPGQCVSLQMHYNRSEHWIVISGTAKVTIDEEEKYISENESIFIPKTTKHRLENPGKIPLQIIEVQNGRYLEEDDIVRFEDIYGRA